MAEAQKHREIPNGGNTRNNAPSVSARGAGDLSLLPEDLQKCSWDQLLEMFSSALREHEQIDKELQEQTMELLKIFEAWSQVTISRDEERSYRRFQTRMQHVQNSEHELEEKKKHSMSDAPNNQDERLLERLNALKPSTVQLERQKNLALNSNPSAASLFPEYTDSAADFTVARKLDNFARGSGSLLAEDDVIAPESLLDGDAIEDLLASLDDTQGPDLGVQLPTHTREEQGQKRGNTKDLLSGANEFIQHSSSSTGAGAEVKNPTREKAIPDFLQDREDNEQSSSDDEKDEVEAAKYVEDLLNELSANPPSESPPEAVETTTSEGINSNENNKDDDTLSTRLAALSLPSVPSDQPRKRNKRENAYPECCCICYDKPAVKCTDCEGDQLFCVRCWWEMHMDDGAESRHKAIKYNP
ncbi:hypothetical protein UA08_07836 [Talaromyces atroroseus]|uniref:Zinc finger FYVE domain-containing protein 19 n=1 Tax=Talaromyces atroroseus TaxID=1441469 RepID=A0A225AMQ4_TALAT|nr:hypothetical protein UA08_07836 [Talaromyces atroroseus]OKL56869.1 hypothetical protein UA08_07836 [Talaromyces atroroseus]